MSSFLKTVVISLKPCLTSLNAFELTMIIKVKKHVFTIFVLFNVESKRTILETYRFRRYNFIPENARQVYLSVLNFTSIP
jgi:hypothetical protein